MKVEVRCICPVPTEHRDTVTLKDTLDFRGAMACKQALLVLRVQDPEAGEGEVLALFTEHYILHGVESWSLREKVDGKLQPVPATTANIRRLLLTQHDVAFQVADVADELYTEAVLLPLLQGASTSSPPTQTADVSTSPTNGSEPTPLKRSKRSSTTTSQTDVIAATSPSLDGVSSSSQSSTSAA